MGTLSRPANVPMYRVELRFNLHTTKEEKMRFIRTGKLLLYTGLSLFLLGSELLQKVGVACSEGRIVFTSKRDGNQEIYVMDSDGRNQKRLTKNPKYDTHPSWSPDGQKIVFSSLRKNSKHQLYVMDCDGKNQQRLTDGWLDMYPSWSPDGQKIAYWSLVIADKTPGIYVMDSDGKNRAKLKDNRRTSLSWSPDSRKIAFVSKVEKGTEIYVMSADGTNVERLTHDLATKSSPSWSPDGRQVAYAAFRDGPYQIYTVALDGKKPHKLSKSGTSDNYPSWSPDGQMIAFVSLRDAGAREQIHLMTAEGKYRKRLSSMHFEADFDPDWHNPNMLVVQPKSKYATIWGRLKQ